MQSHIILYGAGEREIPRIVPVSMMNTDLSDVESAQAHFVQTDMHAYSDNMLDH